MLNADCVCHFAAAFRESGVDDNYFLQRNVQGTTNVLKAAAEAGVKRIVTCSTAGIYGKSVAGTIDESFKVQPWNVYERSKVSAEKVVREQASLLGIEYVILRPVSVYGPRDERLLKLFRSAAQGRFPQFGTGDGRRHMVYVTDLAEAFLKACTTPQAASKELIIAGPKAVPLREMLGELAVAVERRSVGPRLPLKPMQWLSAIVEDISKKFDISPPLYRRRMDFYTNDAAYNTRFAETVLGWRAKTDLREGIALTLESYRDQGLVPRPAVRSHAVSGFAMYGVTTLLELADLTLAAF